ncbi:MAG: nucleotide exchange factor GrpE [Anaerolineae bacterium]
MSEQISEAQAEPVEDELIEADTETAVPEEAPLTLEEQLAAAQAEAAHNLDGWQRAQADLANARKRFEKQQIEIYGRTLADVVGKLLPALDDFERALENVPGEIADHSWFDGVALVQRKLLTLLESLNVKPIEAVGQPFDPNFHEAVMQEPSDEFESGVVARELQKGYQIGDRVIRPSLVNVAE